MNMGTPKKNAPLQRGASDSIGNAHHDNEGTTGNMGISKKARRAHAKLAPWDSWLTPVSPADGYFPGAVKTTNCPYCGGVHFYIGRTCPDDPGIRQIPCRQAERKEEWQVAPYPKTTVLCREVA